MKIKITKGVVFIFENNRIEFRVKLYVFGLYKPGSEVIFFTKITNELLVSNLSTLFAKYKISHFFTI